MVPPATPARGNDWRGANGWSKSKGWTGPDGWPQTLGPAVGVGTGPGGPAHSEPFEAAYGDPASSAGSIRISGALRHPGTKPSGLSSTGANRVPPATGISGTGPRVVAPHGADDLPMVTGVPAGRPAGSPGAPFDVFTPIRRAGYDGAPPAVPAESQYPRSYPDFGGRPSDASRPGSASETGTGDREAGDARAGEDRAGDDGKGLPRRVRQASLAPELRVSAAAASGGQAGVPRASAESLTVMRNTLTALQRGWQQGRSQSPGMTEGTVDGS